MHGGGVRVREAESGDAGWREEWLEADIVGGKGGNTTVRGRAGQAWWGDVAAGRRHVPTMTSFLLISPDIVDGLVVE